MMKGPGMFLRCFWSRSSRYVIHKSESDSEVDDHTSSTAATSLTVWRKSLVFSCHGFTVIDSNGDLVYRVDNYLGAQPGEMVLMDGSGHPILTLVRQKKMKLLKSWHVYKGETSSEHSVAPNSSTGPIYTVNKKINVSSSSSPRVLANVYSGGQPNQKKLAYTIRGSYLHRSCKILEGYRNDKVVAEIKRKKMRMKSGEGVSFGMEVFVLAVQPGFDLGVAMGLVLLLDQMFS